MFVAIVAEMGKIKVKILEENSGNARGKTHASGV